MNKSFYFPHDYNASNDVKILLLRQQLGMEGYGTFWFIIEHLAQSGGKLPLKIIPVIAMQCQTQEAKVNAIINAYELFEVTENEFFSRRLNKHVQVRKKLSKQGKKGAESRWNKDGHPNGGANGVANGGAIGVANGVAMANPMQRKGKESKGEESRGDAGNDDMNQLKSKIFEMMYRATKGYSNDDLNKEVNKFINYWHGKELNNIGAAVNAWAAKLSEKKSEYQYATDPSKNVW